MPAKLYEWDLWFSKPSVNLRKGKHYDCPQSSFYQQILNAAHKRGIRVRVVDRNDGFDILVVNPQEVVCPTSTSE